MYLHARPLSFVSALTIAAVSMSAVNAQTTNGEELKLEEIVVTAQRREENIQKTPMNVTVMTGAEIAKQGLNNMQEILGNIPGVTVQGQVRGFVATVRGLGTDLPPGSSQGAVATEFDGVYDIRAESGRLGYYDLARVEVLAGPQGTLYGVNSDGGVVNVITNKPTIGKFQASGGLELGNYNLQRMDGMVNLPVSEHSSLRVAYASINRDGYLSNGQSDDIGQGGRAKYLYQPSDDFSLLVGMEINKLGGVGQGSVQPYIGDNATQWNANPWTAAPSVPAGSLNFGNSWDRYHDTKYWADLSMNVGFGVLSATQSYKIDHDVTYTCGNFGPPPSICQAGADPNYLRQHSSEVRLSEAADSKIKWNVGLYDWYYTMNTLGGPGGANGSTYWQESQAVFGEITYPFTDSLRVRTGVRHSKDWRKDDSHPAGKDWKHTDYRLGLEYDATANSMLYATLATGYRPGGFNTCFGPCPAGTPDSYETEQVTDVEVGAKNRFLNDRVQLNGDVFYYDFKNYQLLDFYFDPTIPFFSPPPTYNLKARNFGVDLSLQALLTDSDTLTVSGQYLKATFETTATLKYNDPITNVVQNFNVVPGVSQPHAPKLSANLTYEHSFALQTGKLTLRPAIHYSDSYYTHPLQNSYFLQPAYTTYDASLAYAPNDGNWTVNFYGRNLGDKAVKAQAIPMVLSAPRTYGVVLTARFE